VEITFLGMNCVRLTSKDIALLCDPYAAPEIKLTNDASLLTFAGMPTPTKGGMVIDGPGEYELKGTMITGVPAQRYGAAADQPAEATIYNIVIDGIRVAYLGDVAASLSNEQAETIGQADVLILPVGDKDSTLSAAEAAAITSQLEPKYVIPTRSEDKATLEAFLKEVGSNPEPMPKLRVTPRDLPLETTVVVLQRSGN
jgi:L-ascorbate metabolism protein UlaG (beta-lactamase superfamily)